MEEQRKARGRNDADLHDDLPTPSHSGSRGGGIATDIGSRDEERNALGGDPDRTRVTKGDRIQPRIPTRADHEGASR